jgi:hypothetical protein
MNRVICWSAFFATAIRLMVISMVHAPMATPAINVNIVFPPFSYNRRKDLMFGNWLALFFTLAPIVLRHHLSVILPFRTINVFLLVIVPRYSIVSAILL